MNGFYDIAEEGINPEHPFQLQNFGPQIPMLTIGSSSSRNDWGGRESRSQTFYRATTEEDYDNAFVRKIEETYPPYKIELLLDHHYEQYINKVPAGYNSFVKHVRYAVLPAIKGERRGVFSDIINNWLNSKKEIIAMDPTAMTINQKLNKVLEFMVTHQDRIDITGNTIQKEIFNGSITFSEAQELYLRVMRTRKVKVLGYQFLGHSLETSAFLDSGGFGGEHNSNTTIKIKSIMSSQEKELEVMKVFVTYAWGDAEHEKKVRSFTNLLREKGIHAEMDVMLRQKETTINFTKMMHLAMQYPKVIVVLSENYKSRADTFAGGVGTEYTLLINDIRDNPNKYILVSFNGRSQNIVPFGLKGNDIVDLSLPDGVETLFRKLTDQHKYIFAEVATKVPKLDPVKIDEYKAEMAPADKMLNFLTKPREWSKDPGNVRHAYYKPQPEYKIEFTELEKFNMKESFCYYYLDPNSRIGDALFYYHGTILFQCKYMACDGMRIYLPVPEIAGISDDNYKEWYYYYNLSDLSGKLLGWFTDQSYSFSSGRASQPPFLIFKDKNEQKAFNFHAKRHLATIMQIEVGFLGSQAASEKNKANDQSQLNPAFLDQISQFHEREWAKLHKF